jgi:hypothetical protein
MQSFKFRIFAHTKPKYETHLNGIHERHFQQTHIRQFCHKITENVTIRRAHYPPKYPHNPFFFAQRTHPSNTFMMGCAALLAGSLYVATQPAKADDKDTLSRDEEEDEKAIVDAAGSWIEGLPVYPSGSTEYLWQP